MNVTIHNRTPYLNDFYFRTLCMLYFPGEKFREGAEEAGENAASFLLEERADGFFCCTELNAGGRTAKGSFSTAGYRPYVEMTNSDLAALALGKAYLEAGRKLFGFSLPWGYLLGLRPVKRAKYYLDRGYSAETVEKLFVEDYGVQPQKATLAVETAQTEIEMLRDTLPTDCALYLSIPFCPTKCAYCSFVSCTTPRLLGLLPAYLERLKRDITDTCRVIREQGMRLTSVYVGGGTPSILTEVQLRDLLGHLQTCMPADHLREFSFEAGRPDTITPEKLHILKESGVRRISVNPQTTDEEVLRRIGRQHSMEAFFSVADAAMKEGFDVVNADLIAGLPGDTLATFEKSLADVMAIGFENITIHTLSVKKAAPLRFSEDGVYDPAGALARECVEYAWRTLKENGWLPYYLYRQKNIVGNAENVGYAKAGKENLYNVLMMEEYSTVFACGAGAITKLVSPDRNEICRIAFPKYPYEYLDASDGIREPEIRSFFASLHEQKG
ncbi:MAG: coproporphyrinogen dehydrogenase HemZ [Oscillospiraceae bacterium]|nr:coproporphyrinogen dehydrogenase HemZ [Oscillospiraceae bacterium]